MHMSGRMSKNILSFEIDTEAQVESRAPFIGEGQANRHRESLLRPEKDHRRSSGSVAMALFLHETRTIPGDSLSEIERSALSVFPLGQVAVLFVCVIPQLIISSLGAFAGDHNSRTCTCGHSRDQNWFTRLFYGISTIIHGLFLLHQLYNGLGRVSYNLATLVILGAWQALELIVNLELPTLLQCYLLCFLNVLLVVMCCLRVAESMLILQKFATQFAREVVSMKKRRFVDKEHDLDLDLSYVTRNVIAMSFPSVGPEAAFRNAMADVQRFFEIRHKGCYRVYNLCSERTYCGMFESEYDTVRFPDHSPCPLGQLLDICNDMYDFCSLSKNNVVVVHCLAGKGRTGLVIVAFLLRAKICNTVVEALDLYARRRTYDGTGVAVPSQVRYAHYFGSITKERNALRAPRMIRLLALYLEPFAPSKEEGWILQLIDTEGVVLFDSSLPADRTHSTSASPPFIEGDIKFALFVGKRKLFHFWLHTAYDGVEVDSGALNIPQTRMTAWASHLSVSPQPVLQVTLQTHELDGLHKKKEVTLLADGHLTLVFSVATEQEATDLRLVASKSRASHATRRANAVRATVGAVQDYEILEDDTDNEEILSTIMRGYVLRDRSNEVNRCWLKPGRQMCELIQPGSLFIAGRTPEEILYVDLTEDFDSNIRAVASQDGSEHRCWKVQNTNSRAWETLEVDEKDAPRWCQAFTDCRQMCLIQKQPGTYVYSGYFWELHEEVNAGSVLDGFKVEQWKMRLFVLSRDGKLLVYPHQGIGEIIIANFGAGDGHSLLDVKWIGMPQAALFHICGASCQKERILMGKLADYLLFALHTTRLSEPARIAGEGLFG